ncbi:general secretion pathway protein GspB [Steroidobacter sp. S1-65]|uniref:General secretion pathway protein GspB n=1 Tax=Steroidobacter gossypii TaxID=2805490 RepID=A0ABS1WTQ2_9GAMM|nr:general secretion pathway protein GspB [Steroidobacter gossypii]MBM0104364.1 general secretion pathway protein GspB [Steroidobacter gossypii]
MSFILDALKKSENERQRQLGPSLADVRIVRRRTERPWWAVGLAALLVVNLGILLFVLIRDGDAMPAPARPQQAQAPAPQQSYNVAPPPAQVAPQQSYNPAPPAPAQQYQYQQPQASRHYQPELVPTDPSVRSLADEAGLVDPYADPSTNPNLAGAAMVPDRSPMVRQIQPPAVSPAPSGAAFEARTPANAPAAGALAGNEMLPTLNDLTASGTTLPDLHLDIHVNAANPSERFVFVNMRKYVEGETLKEGPTVERIIAEGVVLNQRGLRFLLPRQ